MPGRPNILPASRDDYGTPRDLFDGWWDEAGGFDVDPCTSPDHYTAKRVLANGGIIYVPPSSVARENEAKLFQRGIMVDGLEGLPWRGKTAFCNPPYGLVLRKWVPRMVHMVAAGYIGSVWALLPARTSTVWWQKYVINRVTVKQPESWIARGVGLYFTEPAINIDVRFLPGRLKFEGAPWAATFPSALVIWSKP